MIQNKNNMFYGEWLGWGEGSFTGQSKIISTQLTLWRVGGGMSKNTNKISMNFCKAKKHFFHNFLSVQVLTVSTVAHSKSHI